MMRAAVLEQLNEPLAVEELQLPRSLDYGQVLVRVYASGICGAQLREMCGAKGDDPYLPHLLGHEGGGVVIECGPGVSTVKQGDHVVLHWRKGRGIEALPPRYSRNGGGKGEVGGGWVTTFNDTAVVSENRVTRVDPGVPHEVAALMGCAVTTALGLINNEAKLKIGQSIAVAGCGGVGLNVIQGATMVTANPIIAIDKVSDKLVMATQMGATETICTGEECLLAGVRRIVGKNGVDVFVDCTGDVRVIDEGLQATAPGGRLVLVGQPHCSQTLMFTSAHRNYCGKVIMDSQGGLTDPSIDIPRYLDLYMRGKLQLDALITHRYLLDEVNTAVEKVQSGLAGKVILRMDNA